jgi:hypothetical protein
MYLEWFLRTHKKSLAKQHEWKKTNITTLRRKKYGKYQKKPIKLICLPFQRQHQQN